MTETRSSLGITPRAADFAAWYQDVITAADLAEHADVKGAMIIKPYGFALWERFQEILDREIKATGHQNAYFPLFIPKSFFGREAAHVEGFAKEMAVVTHHRLKKSADGIGLVVDPEARLAEELIVRPTSETVIHSAFARWIKSWRDLPVLINQWVNVVRWELRPRMFLRTTEFLWQEGHTAHATEAEAEQEAKTMLEVYRKFAEEVLAMPVVVGQKSEAEKFPGALRTYAIEALMQDGKALQAGTSHNLGQNFAKAFGVQYLDQQNQLQYAWMTSWGVSTRLIGGLIMSHSDDKGLVLPPKIASMQVVIVPITKTDADEKSVSGVADKLAQALTKQGIRCQIDRRDHLTLGEKLYAWEKRGVPVRIEIGPRDVAQKQIVAVRRDTPVKESIPLEQTAATIGTWLEAMQTNLFTQAAKRMAEQTAAPATYAEFLNAIEAGGFFMVSWCGRDDCEARIKEETKATIRVIPFDQPQTLEACLKCGNEGKYQVILARAY